MRNTIVIAALLLMVCSGCKKTSISTTNRQTQYTLTPQHNSGIWGTVTFIEVKDSSLTKVDIEVNNTPAPTYVAHIHQGPPTSYHGAIYYFDPIHSSGGHVSYLQNIPLLYDSALLLNCTFAFHDYTGDTVLGYCGVGINR